MKNVLIAPNSFKGCADSTKVAELFYKYLSVNRDLNLQVFPISDGGDGFLNVCKRLYNIEIKSYIISTPYDESKLEVDVGYELSSRTVFIESALVLGLSLIPMAQRKVIQLSSKGMGELLVKLIEENNSESLLIEKVIIGIGGTGTNDMGLGMCSRFGLKLWGHFNERLNIIPDEFPKVSKMEWQSPKLPFRIECVIDVNNKLLGKSGSTYQFAEQKGATKGELEIMELGFTKIVNLLYSNKIYDPAKMLYGAGGGLGAGFQIFYQAECKHAREFIQNEFVKKFNNQAFDILITGEGSFDTQSLTGKGSYSLIDNHSESIDRVFLCSGKIDSDLRNKVPSNVICIQLRDYFNSDEESINSIEIGIRRACEIILEEINS